MCELCNDPGETIVQRFQQDGCVIYDRMSIACPKRVPDENAVCEAEILQTTKRKYLRRGDNKEGVTIPEICDCPECGGILNFRRWIMKA